MPKHQRVSRELYQDIKARLDRNLSTDVLNTIVKILVGISPNICSLMSIYSVVFSPEQFTSLKTILINYERGVIHEKKDAFAEITQLFTGLST
jgi:hypothetical protein